MQFAQKIIAQQGKKCALNERKIVQATNWQPEQWEGVFLLRLLANIGEDAAVDIEHMAIDSVRGVRSEEHSGASEF